VTRALGCVFRLLSLLPLAAAGVLWAQSYHVSRIAFWVRPGVEIQAAASRGSLWVYWASEPGRAPRAGEPAFHVERYGTTEDPRTWGYGAQNIPYAFDLAGIAFGHGTYTAIPGRQAAVFIIPCWLAALLAAVPPAWAGRRWYVSRTRDKAGCCPDCGYDLRATPDRCPECGRTIAIPP
jgi:hypothetical protein